MARREKAELRRPSPPAPPRTRDWPAGLSLFVLILVSFAIYAGSLRNGFVSDDDFQVLSNRMITDYRNIPKLFTTNVWAFAEAEVTNYYRPLHMLIYMAEYFLFAFDSFWWHLANLVFHAAALAAAYFLVRALADHRLAFWAALWFALHPIHVEAVVWVAVITDMLCGLALFAGLWLYHRARTASRPLPFHAFAALVFFAGLLMKETAFVFPALLLAYDFLYCRESVVQILRGLPRFLPYGAVLAAYIAMRLHALGKFAPASGLHYKLTPGEMLLSVPVLLGQYVWKLFVPVNLNYYYVFEPTRALGWRPLAGMLLAVGLVVAIFWLRRAQPLLAFSLAWFLLTLTPVLSIQNVGENVFTERYLYIPSLGFCVVAAWAWLEVQKRLRDRAARQVAWAALAALFLFYVVQTVRRVPDWHDDIRLFTRTAEQSPNSATILTNLGYIYYLHGQVDRSIDFYQRSLALNSDRALTHNNLGNSLSTKGRYAEAAVHLRRAIELKPDYYAAWLNLGLVYANQKQWDKAIEAYRAALQLKPGFAEALTAMGLARWSKGEPAAAVAAYRQAIAAKPDYIQARINLASALSEMGQNDEAIEHLLAALKIDRTGAYASVVHFNLGVNYERKGRWDAAMVEYDRALAVNPNFPEARRRLDIARARQPASTQPPAPLSPLQRRF